MLPNEYRKIDPALTFRFYTNRRRVDSTQRNAGSRYVGGDASSDTNRDHSKRRRRRRENDRDSQSRRFLSDGSPGREISPSTTPSVRPTSDLVAERILSKSVGRAAGPDHLDPSTIRGRRIDITV